jgi:hypothetical protein
MEFLRRLAERDTDLALGAFARRACLWAMASALLVCLLVLRTGDDPFQPDSISYLEFHRDRTAGYPLFLIVLRGLGLGPDGIVVAQAALLAAAAAAFASALARHARSLAVGVGALALILGHPLLGTLAFSIVTEPLFVVCLMMAARGALDARWIRTALWIGLAIAIRPTGWALLPAAALAATAISGVWRARLSRAALTAGLCAALALAGNFAKSSLVSGQTRLDFGRFSLLGRVLLETPRANLEALGLAEIAPRLASVSATLERAPDWRTRYLLNAVYYNHMLYTVAAPLLEARRSEIGVDALSEAVDAALLAAAVERGPALLAMAADDLAALWIWADLMTRAEAREQMRIFGHMSPFPEIDTYPYTIGGWPAWIVLPLRAVLVASFFASLILPVWALARRRPDAAGIVFLALAIHGAFALTAMANTGVPRYSVVLWPFQLALVGLAWAAMTRAPRGHRVAPP